MDTLIHTTVNTTILLFHGLLRVLPEGFPTTPPLRECEEMDASAFRATETVERSNSSEKRKGCYSLHTLCAICQSATSVLTEIGRIQSFQHHLTPADLVRSAFDGCHLCSLLLSTIRIPLHLPHDCNYLENQGPTAADVKAQDHTEEPSLKLQLIFYPKLGRIGLAKWPLSQGSLSPSKLCMQIEKDVTTDAIPIWTSQLRAQTSQCTASDATFELASDWIRHCRSTHQVCNKTRYSASVLPTRLLDLRPINGKAVLRLRLSKDIVSEDKTATIEYMALSHRWGMSPTMRLLQDQQGVKKDLESGIPLHVTPATFRDAAMITYRLGYRYLWIDSLCIIQDCISDWIAESSIMGEIYRGSICTIAALGAKDSHSGCFQVRNPLKFLPCHLNSTMKVSPRSRWEPVFLEGELLQRGWVVQERVLAPATLFYGSSGIFWECNSYQSTEAGLTNFSTTPKTDFHTLLSPFTADHRIERPTMSLVSFHKAWAKLLELYTSTQLTRQTDRLVAIHGMVTQISKAQHLTSVAGLWQEMLPSEMLWHTEKPKNWEEKLEHYLAPSWSWASLDSPVTNSWTKLVTPQHSKEYAVRVDWKVAISELQVTSMKNGEFVNGTLRMKGPLRKLPVGTDQASGGLMYQERDWAAMCGEDHGLHKQGCGFHDGTITRSKVFPDHFWTGPAPRALHVLWMARSVGTELRDRDGVIEPRMIDVGLVLEKVGSSEERFRRRGYFEQYFYGNARSYLFSDDQEFRTSFIQLV